MSRPLNRRWLITLTILGEEYRLWSWSLWNFLHDPSTSILGPNILFNTVLKNPQSVFLPQSEWPQMWVIGMNYDRKRFMNEAVAENSRNNTTVTNENIWH
jgi:hypothetical protein